MTYNNDFNHILYPITSYRYMSLHYIDKSSYHMQIIQIPQIMTILIDQIQLNHG